MGRGGEKAKGPGATAASDGNDSKMEVLVDGVYYDVTDYAKKHPGGTVMNFYAGKDIDATQAFANFHLRSKKAKKIMDSLKQRPADPKVRS